jgi:hypothetical protein
MNPSLEEDHRSSSLKSSPHDPVAHPRMMTMNSRLPPHQLAQPPKRASPKSENPGTLINPQSRGSHGHPRIHWIVRVRRMLIGLSSIWGRWLGLLVRALWQLVGQVLWLGYPPSHFAIKQANESSLCRPPPPFFFCFLFFFSFAPFLFVLGVCVAGLDADR